MWRKSVMVLQDKRSILRPGEVFMLGGPRTNGCCWIVVLMLVSARISILLYRINSSFIVQRVFGRWRCSVFVCTVYGTPTQL